MVCSGTIDSQPNLCGHCPLKWLELEYAAVLHFSHISFVYESVTCETVKDYEALVIIKYNPHAREFGVKV